MTTLSRAPFEVKTIVRAEGLFLPFRTALSDGNGSNLKPEQPAPIRYYRKPRSAQSPSPPEQAILQLSGARTRRIEHRIFGSFFGTSKIAT